MTSHSFKLKNFTGLFQSTSGPAESQGSLVLNQRPELLSGHPVSIRDSQPLQDNGVKFPHLHFITIWALAAIILAERAGKAELINALNDLYYFVSA